MVRSTVETPRVVKVTYTISQTFKVPIGTDLDDKTQVAEWEIQDQELRIKYTDGTFVREEWINEMTDIDDQYQQRTDEWDAEDFELSMFEDDIEEYLEKTESKSESKSESESESE